MRIANATRDARHDALPLKMRAVRPLARLPRALRVCAHTALRSGFARRSGGRRAQCNGRTCEIRAVNAGFRGGESNGNERDVVACLVRREHASLHCTGTLPLVCVGASAERGAPRVGYQSSNRDLERRDEPDVRD
eukprot:IDg15137t1